MISCLYCHTECGMNPGCPKCDVGKYREELRKDIQKMKETLPSILWKNEHEENVMKASYNRALDDVLTLLHRA